MPVSNYPNGFAQGVTIRGLPVLTTNPGKVFWLNNSAVLGVDGVALSNGAVGIDQSGGGTYQQPFKTLSYAISQCVASRGDMIVAMPGHAESVSSSTALSLNIAGVAIIGLGHGSLRPTFTLDTANTSTINITANNISIVNCIFKANFAAIVACFTTTTASDLALINCEFRDVASNKNFVNIVDTDATSNHTDGLYIDRCKRIGAGATSNTTIIKMDGTNDRLTVRDCYFSHAAVTAAGLMPIATGKVVTNALIENNICNFVGATSTTTGILITTDGSTNSGMICKNLIQSLDATTEILVTASSGFNFSQNYYSGAADASGYLLPAADS